MAPALATAGAHRGQDWRAGPAVEQSQEYAHGVHVLSGLTAMASVKDTGLTARADRTRGGSAHWHV